MMHIMSGKQDDDQASESVSCKYDEMDQQDPSKSDQIKACKDTTPAHFSTIQGPTITPNLEETIN